MAVPKKKTSKGVRPASCPLKAKACVVLRKALSAGKAVLSGRAQGFVYPMPEEDGEAES